MSNSAAVDMTYRFHWDSEPTDEQLEQLMQEVAENVREQSARIQNSIKEKIKKATEEVRRQYHNP